MAVTSAPTHTIVSFLFYSLSTLVRHTSANCYWPNGTDRNVAANANYSGSVDEYYAPCNPGNAASMCCAIGPARSGDADTCTSNGLCLASDGTTWWRESCTDQTWTDPNCVQLYVNGTYDGTENSGNDVPMTLCPDGSYCTGTGAAATPCCDNHQGYFVLSNLTVTQQNPNSSTSASTSSATSTSMTSSTSSMAATASSAATSPTPTSSSSSGLSTGAEAGIGVGAAIAALAIIALLFWITRLKRSNARGRHVEGTTHDTRSPPPPPPPQYDPPKEAPSAPPAPVHEAYGTPGPHSGPHFMNPVEMEQPGAQIPRR